MRRDVSGGEKERGGRAEVPRPDVRPGSRVAKELTLQDQTASIQTQVPPRVSGDLW